MTDAERERTLWDLEEGRAERDDALEAVDDPPMAHRPSPCPGCATCRPRRERLATALVGAAALLVWAYFFLVLLPALAS